MDSIGSLPIGTVTFLFTDIEGSTRLWEEHLEAMRLALARHNALLIEHIQQHGGVIVKSRGEGDSLFAVFARATAATAAALAAQQALLSEPWPAETPLQVRMALHTGEADLRQGDYFGPGVNRCARLRAVAHGGQVLLSQAVADQLPEQLPEGVRLRDLGTHRLKDLQRPERIFQLLHPALPADFPPLRSLEALAHNLPVQLTRFIGREREVGEAKRLLANAHLLTLTGPGGCGKTRLALQIGADLIEEYADGVWLVELAPLVDPALVPQTVAAALGVKEEPGRFLIQTLISSLRPKQLLLLLDNCEHLLSACAQLADSLLRACPSLRVLTSSREGLGIAGEQTYRVPSLSVPDPRQLPLLDRLLEFESVQLFADRAGLSQPSFTVTRANAAAVAEVCQRLDGIPLAIELAAVQVKALPVEQIAERLDDRFRLLTGGSRTALPRQQTLRALIDWSYDLLAEPERTLLRRLSVFAGGWTLAAAEAICPGDGLEAWEALTLHTALVEKSLVQYDPQGRAGRYRLLETVRQYGRDRLLETGEAAVVCQRHQDWCLRLVEQAEPELGGAAQQEWLERLNEEHDNLRAALDWSVESGEAEAGLRMGGGLWWFWQVRGYLEEGRARLAALLRLKRASAGTAARAKALHGAAVLAINRGDYRAGRAFAEESLAIQRQLGNTQGIASGLGDLARIAQAERDYRTAWALHQESLALRREMGDKRRIAISLASLAGIAQAEGDHEAARALYEEGRAIHAELGDTGGIASSLGNLGQVAHEQGDYAAARVLYQEALAIFRELDYRHGIAVSLGRLGSLAYEEGDYQAARALHEETLAIDAELGDSPGIAVSLANLGLIAKEQGEYAAARTLCRDSLTIFRELEDERYLVACLEALAAIASADEHRERAARLFGAAAALRTGIGALLPPNERVQVERWVADARAALGGEAFAAAWAEGQAMSLEEAVRYALEDA